MAPTTGPEQVRVHPLVLLSVVDHYNRIAKDTKKRVVGVLLGESRKGIIEATNSFAGTWLCLCGTCRKASENWNVLLGWCLRGW